MTEFTNKNIFRVLYLYLPIILLFISVLNEFDFNYMNFKYFSFNFPYILIFYWSLKKPDYLGYGLIFISGLFNDVVVGTPIGLSSFSYLLICGFAAYLRYITLRPSLTKDWIFFFSNNYFCKFNKFFDFRNIFYNKNGFSLFIDKYYSYIFVLCNICKYF